MQIPFPQASDSPLEKLSLLDGEVLFYPGFIAEQEADSCYNTLYRDTPWRQDHLNFGGKSVPIPRLQAWYGETNSRYGYSGLALNPLPWTPLLATLKARIEVIADTTFNSVLVNYYRDGRDSVSWHSDDEKELGKDPVIASLSFGASRNFALRHRNEKGQKFTCALTNGSLLVMGAGIQRNWQHQVPKQPAVCEGRINLTFRAVLQEQ
jgi:alkylated DNA repair dioxygenase AlkB